MKKRGRPPGQQSEPSQKRTLVISIEAKSVADRYFGATARGNSGEWILGVRQLAKIARVSPTYVSKLRSEIGYAAAVERQILKGAKAELGRRAAVKTLAKAPASRAAPSATNRKANMLAWARRHWRTGTSVKSHATPEGEIFDSPEALAAHYIEEGVEPAEWRRPRRVNK